MTTGTFFKTKAVLLTACAAFALQPNAAYAQSPQVIAYNIEAQNLGTALTELAKQSDKEIYFSSALTRGKRVAPLKGSLTLEQALTRLLANTVLTYRMNSNGSIVIEQGATDVGKLSQGASKATGPSGEGASAPVTGKLTDERTGSNLKGAQVTIEETGQTTSTDDLGNYRFPGIRPGRYTLRISYLGYRDIVATITVEAGREVAQKFAMIGGNGEAEIIVYGTRAGRAQSLNQQRTAPNNSEVVSADLLGNFTGTTISEALRRVPGVSFQQDSLTGEGANIIIRGLEPNLNTVKVNGLRLPDNSGTGRSGDLSNILADSVSKITVHKSLLPSHYSTGTGGLVEVETKSPLDRDRRYANLSLEGGKSGKSFSDDLLASATISGKFGAAENFGLSASVQYRERSFSNLAVSQNLNFGQYLPLEADESTSITRRSQIDPRRFFPFEPGVDAVYPTELQIISNDADTSNLTATLSAEWKISEHTNLQLDAQHIIAKSEESSRALSNFFQHSYQELPVMALGGELRQSLAFQNNIFSSQNYGFSDSREKTTSLSFRGATKAGNWDFNYKAGYARGSKEASITNLAFSGGIFGIDSAFIAPQAIDPVEGRVVSIFAPVQGIGPQFPLLTQAGFDALNSPDSYFFSDASIGITDNGVNDRVTGEVSARYSFSGDVLNYLEAGVFYEKAKFATPPYLEPFELYFGNGATVTDFGGRFDQGALARIGVPQDIQGMPPESARNALRNLPSLVGSGLVIPFTFPAQDARLAEQFTKEKELSGYLEAALNIGKLELIGGVRINSVDVQSRQLSAPSLILADGTFDFVFQESNTEIVDIQDSVTDILPRFLVNYRPSDNLIFRGGYYLSIARPTLDSLSRTPNISLDLRPVNGPDANQPQLVISLGNPGLKPASTHNFDFTVERYSKDIGVMKLGVFYKRIDNFLQSISSTGFSVLDNVPLPDDPRFQNLPDDIFISALRPNNASGVAEIWGFDASIEHRFTSLPGLLSGFGVFANYTYSDSSREVARVWSESPVFNASGALVGREQVEYVLPDVAFAEQPKHSGTAAITYNRNNIDASLAYSKQARRLQRVGDNGLDVYQESTDSLDLRIEYRLAPSWGGQYRLWIEGLDLLDGPSDPTLTSTVGGYFSSGNYIGGRSIKAGISATF